MPINRVPGKPPKDVFCRSDYRRSLALLICTGEKCVEYLRGKITKKGDVYIPLTIAATKKAIFREELGKALFESLKSERLPILLILDKEIKELHESFHHKEYHWKWGNKKTNPICGVYDAPVPFRFRFAVSCPSCFCLRAGAGIGLAEIEDILKYLVRYIPLSLLSIHIKEIAILLNEKKFLRFVREDVAQVEALLHLHKGLKEALMKSPPKNQEELVTILKKHGLLYAAQVIENYIEYGKKHENLMKKMDFKKIFNDYTFWYISSCGRFHYMVKGNDMDNVEEIFASYGLLKKFGTHEEAVRKLEEVARKNSRVIYNPGLLTA